VVLRVARDAIGCCVLTFRTYFIVRFDTYNRSKRERVCQLYCSYYQVASTTSTEYGARVQCTVQLTTQLLSIHSRGCAAPITAPFHSKVSIFTALYLDNYCVLGSQQKKLRFGHGAAPRAQIRGLFHANPIVISARCVSNSNINVHLAVERIP
jgi:hypothetical protein